MSYSKNEQPFFSQDTNIFGRLNQNISREKEGYLSIEEIEKKMRSSISTYSLFEPSFSTNWAITASICVVNGDVEGLVSIASNKPAVLFQKVQTTDPRGRVFYDASAYQLIKFLCDKDMEDKINKLIPANLFEIRQEQEEIMDIGGYDLIKVNFNPIGNDFKKITEFKTTYQLYEKPDPQEVTFPLLQNPDGIIYYQDENNVVHLYYANQDKQEIQELEVFLNSEDKQVWNTFIASFVAMENNSGRRSSNEEHYLIEKILQRQLQRKGIVYKEGEVSYQDNCTSFRLINVYRTCVRLYLEAENNQWPNGKWDLEKLKKAHAYWREGVGKAQGEEMWLLQRICEKRPYYPTLNNPNDFKRGFLVFSYYTGEDESVFLNGKLVAGLGSDFAVYKGSEISTGAFRFSARGDIDEGSVLGAEVESRFDLIAISRLVEAARANKPTYTNEKTIIQLQM